MVYNTIKKGVFNLKSIINAKIYTMAGEIIEDGVVVFDKKIIYVGEDKSRAGGEIIDASGLIVMPGLVDAHCHVGMFEDSLGF